MTQAVPHCACERFSLVMSMSQTLTQAHTAAHADAPRSQCAHTNCPLCQSLQSQGYHGEGACSQCGHLVCYRLIKACLAARLHEQHGFSKRESREFVDIVIGQIREALAANQQVKLSGFGNFDLRNKQERPGRNPKTGEEIPISARRVVTFRPGQKLKSQIETYAGNKR